MVFYVCGSVVTKAQSFNGVKQAAKLQGPSSSLMLQGSKSLQQHPTSRVSWTKL
ncbi:hypothetical protein BKA82DRAFT_36266 [Pisolithus tinctorius]|uniref:Uncharacterized protein n=1 Tax=Pisolithus tinctorius Marx 270 TaxID=870435 RepID=A0A0C3NBG1_PISTI|nr:hypothetical protein BKA82DRAFT_36266 [Pisolithus tinctorius]KIN93235.1 hypothetical protein M404DRAFT_36266 [Pisolithus tinctorius Marx 270]